MLYLQQQCGLGEDIFQVQIAILLILLIKLIQLIRISAFLCGNMIHFHSTSTQKDVLDTEIFSLRPTIHNTSAGRVKSGGKSFNEGVPATVLLIRDPYLTLDYTVPVACGANAISQLLETLRKHIHTTTLECHVMAMVQYYLKLAI